MAEEDRLIVLDKVRFKLAVTIGKAVAQMTTIESYEETADAITAVVQSRVLADKRIACDLRVDFPFPATWWEHLKLMMLPRLPSKWRKKISINLKHYYHRVRVKQYVGYPEANEVLESRWGKPVVFEMWEDSQGGVLFDGMTKVTVKETASWWCPSCQGPGWRITNDIDTAMCCKCGTTLEKRQEED